MEDLYFAKSLLWTQFSHCDLFIRAMLIPQHDPFITNIATSAPRPFLITPVFQIKTRQEFRTTVIYGQPSESTASETRSESPPFPPPPTQFPSFSSSGRSIINATLFAQNTPLLRQCCACPEGSFYLQVVSCSQSLLFCSWKLVEETIEIRDERPICSQSLWKVSNSVTKQN